MGLLLILWLLDKKLKRRVITEGLLIYLTDNMQSWDMDANGIYHPRRSSRHKPRCAQSELIETFKP